MKISLPHVLLGLGSCCAFTQMLGCLPLAGTGTIPNGYPGQPIGIYNPQPYPPGAPGSPISYPGFPSGPGVPIVLKPVPFPGTTPTPPLNPLPNPGTIPTIPIGLPGPAEPKEDPTVFWSPWPLPPRGNQFAVRAVGFEGGAAEGVVRPLNSQVRRGSQSNDQYGAVHEIPVNYVRDQDVSEGTSPTPSEDLKYRGGTTIRDLFYVNLYISGDTEWSNADVERIDGSLSAAMRDEHLNNVLLQYYNNQPISSRALPSHPLVGYTPKTVTRGDIQNYVTWLHGKGFLKSFDLKNTVFNFLLPPGTVLTADGSAANAQGERFANTTTSGANDAVEPFDERDSLAGLAGYHGSVVIANGGRVYFTVAVYSQRSATGAINGIPVFIEPWKNVAATLYHQMVETRTDPDVEDAIRNSSDPAASRSLGWVSDSGLEVGDLPLRENVPLSSVFREVPLAEGGGIVPVQLPYSNFIHGPEGPIPQPHVLPPR